jgi:hypothetical protein
MIGLMKTKSLQTEALLSSEGSRGGVSSSDELLDEYSDELCDKEEGKIIDVNPWRSS